MTKVKRTLKPVSLPRSSSSPDAGDWRAQLGTAFRDAGDLLDYLGIPPGAIRLDERPGFPLLVPKPFVDRMQPGQADDPLLRQVLPLAEERHETAGYRPDPVGDLSSARQPGLLHKYHGRVLLVTGGACAVHCRYCFRREFPYSQQRIGRDPGPVADYIARDRSITELILSGGDPLMLPTRRLGQFTRALEPIAHLRRFRLHTRLPVVLPARVTDALCAWLAALPWPVTIVVHANHPAEFDAQVDRALAKLRQTGAMVFNQAVLLAGVNDRLEVLCELMDRGYAAGVVPYYLHLLDRVRGAAHFEADRRSALRLIDGLRARLPGYLVPRLVREQAGAPYKLPVL